MEKTEGTGRKEKGMKTLLTTMAAMAAIALLCCCDRARNENIIHHTHAYDVIKVNDTTLLIVPTGLTWDGDTMRCQKINI